MLSVECLAWNRANKSANRMLNRRVQLARAFLDINRLIGRTDERTATRRRLRHGAAAEQQRQRAGRSSPADDQPHPLSQGVGSIAR